MESYWKQSKHSLSPRAHRPTYLTLVGEKAVCPNCSTPNTISAELADAYASPRNGAGDVTLECYRCGEREPLGEYSLLGHTIGDIC